ncbi:MAG: glycoside hydrolase family 16 protein [Clostridia bacterium]
MKNINKKFVALIAIVLLQSVLLIGVLSGCKDDEKPVDTNLIFNDDFNTLDTNTWNVYDELRRGGYWKPQQVFTDDGNLVIRTSIVDGNYITGAVDTAGKVEHTFGYYESRCKVPKTHGIWAAFWIMCNGMGLNNPDATIGGAEIDIFESPFYPTNLFQAAIHIGGYGENKIDYSFLTFNLENNGIDVDDFYTDWHTFGLDWQADGYKFYYDDNLIWETNCDNNVSTVNSFLFLSCEIAGTNAVPGQSPFFGGGHPNKNDPDDMPKDFLIDYVRIFKTKPIHR